MSNVTAFWKRIPDPDNDTKSVRVSEVTMEDLAGNIERAIKRVGTALDELEKAQDQLEQERERFASECKRRGLFDGLRAEIENG